MKKNACQRLLNHGMEKFIMSISFAQLLFYEVNAVRFIVIGPCQIFDAMEICAKNMQQQQQHNEKR